MQVNSKFHTKICEKLEVSQNLLARIVDVGNDEYIVVCNFADRVMSSFLKYGDGPPITEEVSVLLKSNGYR